MMIRRYFYGVCKHRLSRLAFLCFLTGIASFSLAQTTQTTTITINWEKTVLISRSTPTLQVVVNPMLRQGSPIHDAAFDAVKQLGADYVRYVPWLPYPKLAVPELEAPTAAGTSWNFALIDPITKDFLAATEGHSTIINFSTIPAWLFQTERPVT